MPPARAEGASAIRGPIDGFWGKLDRSNPDAAEWHPLVDHCADVAACVVVLLRSTLLGKRLARLAGMETFSGAQASRLAVLAALHDAGKFNHGFQNKAVAGSKTTAGHVGELLNLLANPGVERDQVHEALALGVIATWGDSADAAEALLLASVCHHGRPVQPGGAPKRSFWHASGGRDPVGGVAALVRRTSTWLPDAWQEGGGGLPDRSEFHHAYSGLVMLADWLGSDRRFFPFAEPGDPDRFTASIARAEEAARSIGIDPAPARAELAGHPPTFAATFGFDPRGAQDVVLGLRAEAGPSLTVLEAETGSGKTEAALAHYLRLFAVGQVDGLYFALPTRTAATQLHRRVVQAVGRAFPDPRARPPVVLAVPGYLRIDDREGKRLPGFEVLWDDDEGRRLGHRAWAAEHPKRYLAGAVVVGTVDQVLLSALAVNHSHMRATSVLRQLLVVDEVHASDAYMNRLLETVLRRHWEAGGHALLMSATLGSAARSLLLSHTGQESTLPEVADALSAPYPAVLSKRAGDPLDWLRPDDVGREKDVSISLVPSAGEPREIAQMALDAGARGARVLVIRNTVRDCVATQGALERLAREMGCEHLLFRCNGVPAPHHARFAREDRIALDRALEGAFGKDCPSEGRVSVATQTVQQSLDIDADLLISDLCPMDVLLQRLGRLHRHAGRPRPPDLGSPVAVVVVPRERDLTPLMARDGRARGPHGLGTVYEDLRILEATWRMLEARSTLKIPGMNRELVEGTTHPGCLDEVVRTLPARWERHADSLLGATLADRRMATRNLVDWSSPYAEASFPEGDLDYRIQTRLGEGDRLVRFAPPLEGPFGQPLEILTIPAWLAKGLEADAVPEGVTTSDTAARFDLGAHRFRYDRWGLRKEREEAAQNVEDDRADA